MFFQRKGKLRKSFNEQLLLSLEKNKNEWMRQKEIVNRCVEPSEEVLFHLKIAEAKYFFLIREAKQRKVTLLG
ncbi:YaaL family protein [Bacillus pinisoli]|uniref:YaaL family protein n=1 Tax=Bacillus pinisoli TaxID=2901866 RepID=UPI001FF3B946|nr:YaaL family protein [Bacillus pinisoli]